MKVLFPLIAILSLLFISVSCESTEALQSSYDTQYSSSTSFSVNLASSSSSSGTATETDIEDVSPEQEDFDDLSEGSAENEYEEDQNVEEIFKMRSDIEKAINKFSPHFYFHQDEKFFPSRCEDIVDWGKITWDQVRDNKFVVQFTAPKDGQPFTPSAPVYVNVRYYGRGGRNGDSDEIWLTYVHSYNYNDCGPAIKITGKTFKTKVSTSVLACPIGLHQGDNEHVTIAISKNNPDKIRAIWFSQHSGGKWLNRDSKELQWDDGTHVRVFVAKGSHANYPCPGKSVYMNLLDKKSWAADLAVDLVDSAADNINKATKWFPKTRWVAVNGRPCDRLNLSEAERKFASLESRFGSQIFNPKTKTIIKTIMNITWPLRKISSSINRSVEKATKDIESELNPTSSCGLGGKDWFGDDDPKEP